MTEFQVGDVIRIHWSNDHGYSEYRIADNPGSGPHILVHLADYEGPSYERKTVTVTGLIIDGEYASDHLDAELPQKARKMWS